MAHGSVCPRNEEEKLRIIDWEILKLIMQLIMTL